MIFEPVTNVFAELTMILKVCEPTAPKLSVAVIVSR